MVRRVYEHKNVLISGFMKKLLVYFEIYEYFYHALQREKTLKRWQREGKIKAIKELNPHWKDLSETLCV